MRIWFKMMKNNHLLRDTTITDESDETRTHKVFHALEEVCYEFDLGKPIWLEANVNEFKRPCQDCASRRIPLSSRLILIFWKCRLSRRIKRYKLWKEIRKRFQQAVFRFA